MTFLQYLKDLVGWNQASQDSNLRLRPHHIGALYSYLNGDWDELAIESTRISRGERNLEKMDEIGRNRDQLVTIVSGTDDICEACNLHKLCRRKKYKKVDEALKEVLDEVYGKDQRGLSPSNPDAIDQDFLDLLEISPGEEYTLSYLLGEWEKKAKYLVEIKHIRALRQISRDFRPIFPYLEDGSER